MSTSKSQTRRRRRPCRNFRRDSTAWSVSAAAPGWAESVARRASRAPQFRLFCRPATLFSPRRIFRLRCPSAAASHLAAKPRRDTRGHDTATRSPGRGSAGRRASAGGSAVCFAADPRRPRCGGRRPGILCRVLRQWRHLSRRGVVQNMVFADRGQRGPRSPAAISRHRADGGRVAGEPDAVADGAGRGG